MRTGLLQLVVFPDLKIKLAKIFMLFSKAERNFVTNVYLNFRGGSCEI